MRAGSMTRTSWPSFHSISEPAPPKGSIDLLAMRELSRRAGTTTARSYMAGFSGMAGERGGGGDALGAGDQLLEVDAREEGAFPVVEIDPGREVARIGRSGVAGCERGAEIVHVRIGVQPRRGREARQAQDRLAEGRGQ